jgi:hypothetical protein
MQDNRPRIIHTKEFQNEGRITQALQVGPRLVADGKEKIMKEFGTDLIADRIDAVSYEGLIQNVKFPRDYFSHVFAFNVQRQTPHSPYFIEVDEAFAKRYPIENFRL